MNKENELGKIRCVTLNSVESLNIITVFCVCISNDKTQCVYGVFIIVYAICFECYTSNLHTERSVCKTAKSK